MSSKASVGIGRHDEEIYERDPKKGPGLFEPSMQDHVLLAWRDVSAWVVVSNDDAGCIGQDRRGKDFAWMNKAGGERSSADFSDAD